MSQHLRIVVMVVAAALVFQTSAGCQPQEIPASARATMALFQGVEGWPAYGPGDIVSRPGTFRPVRAVFDRATDLATDDPTHVRAVWEVDQVSWEGRPVTLIRWQGVGSAGPRASTGYVVPDTGALLFRTIASQAKVTVTRVDSGRIVDRAIDREGEVASKIAEQNAPVFDRWALGHMMAGMELREGLKLKLKGLYPGVGEVVDYVVYVGARTTIEDARGNAHEVWPVLHPTGGTNVGTYFVDNRAPYFYGFEMRDLMTDQVGMRVALRSFQLLD